MANSNGWGDGAANNSIGWGQGANNGIAWGDSHAKSWAGATDIVGASSLSTLITNFQTRVATDGGAFEASSCLTTTLENLQNIA